MNAKLELVRMAQLVHEDSCRLQRTLQAITEQSRSAGEWAHSDVGRTPCISTGDAGAQFARLAQHVGAYTLLQNLALPPDEG